jgi:hypothetical protein
VNGFLNTLFDWPNGIVVGNLLASVITTSLGLGFAVFHLDRLAKRHHKLHMEAIANAANPRRKKDAPEHEERIWKKER